MAAMHGRFACADLLGQICLGRFAWADLLGQICLGSIAAQILQVTNMKKIRKMALLEIGDNYNNDDIQKLWASECEVAAYATQHKNDSVKYKMQGQYKLLDTLIRA